MEMDLSEDLRQAGYRRLHAPSLGFTPAHQARARVL